MPGISAISEPKLKTSRSLLNRNGSKSLPGLDLMANYVVESPLKRLKRGSVSMLNILMLSESWSKTPCAPMVPKKGLMKST